MPLPEIVTPAELAKRLHWSERRIRALAKQLGTCRILANRMVLTQEDVQAILEATRPKPLGPRPQTYLQSLRSNPGSRLPNVTYEDRVRMRGAEKRKKPSRESGATTAATDKAP